MKRLLLATLLGGLPIGPGHAIAQSRFLSYGSEAECLSAHALAPPLCRSAFANARAEFEARTSNFTSLAQCAKSFGDCAPWPPGSSSKANFRPRWAGVDILDTPKEKSVTPTALGGLRKISFAPQPLTEFRNLDVRATRPAPVAATHSTVRAGLLAKPAVRQPEAPAGTAPPPPAGSGFKMEDGVLTYPAPARFQPKNLPKQP